MKKSYLVLSFFIILSTTSCSVFEKYLYKKENPKVEKEIEVRVQIQKELVTNNIAKPKDYVVSTQHYPADSQSFRIRHLILHYTAGDYETSVKTLTKKAVSSHYLVTDKENDTIDILVLEDKRAFHAGLSYWKGFTSLNDTSIGIEIVNAGFKTVNGKRIFYDYPDFQIKKVAALCVDIIDRYKILPYNVIGHSDVAPNRKQDPGAKFPWKKLYDEYKIGAWYNDEDVKEFENQYPEIDSTTEFIASAQKDFQTYGYDIKPTGIWDEQSKLVISAFQMHFRPTNFDGILDKETWSILQALLKRYKLKLQAVK